MTGMEESTGKHGWVQVIASSASIMRALGNNPHGLSSAVIAEVVDLPRSTRWSIWWKLWGQVVVSGWGRRSPTHHSSPDAHHFFGQATSDRFVGAGRAIDMPILPFG